MKDQVLEQEIRGRIESALDELRPYLEVDEGGIALIEITDDMVA
ncbi:MAG TPA: NifU family protein, partial [Flavobacteriales bacterium]|nr:NifU family protein [Flavobacteriales bacterium]